MSSVKNWDNEDKEKVLKPKDFSTILGADGGTWTPTSLRTLAPEASASAIPPHPHIWLLKEGGASDGTWTRTSIDTRPSNVPVYQFQHTRIDLSRWTACLSATRYIIAGVSPFVNKICEKIWEIFKRWKLLSKQAKTDTFPHFVFGFGRHEKLPSFGKFRRPAEIFLFFCEERQFPLRHFRFLPARFE